MAELKMDDSSRVEAENVTMEGARNVKVRRLISDGDGATGFLMRKFEVGPGGVTPLHTHSWEHEVYILSGDGVLVYEGEEKPFSSGHFIFVPGGRLHSFANTGDGVLEFLCMVPATAKS